MNKQGLGTRILMGALLAIVVTYFGLQAVQYFCDPLATSLAYTYQATDGMDLSGYVIRREQVLPDDTNGLLQLSRAEGERVSKGGTIAAVYADKASLDRQSEIEALEMQIEQLEYAKEASVGAEATVRLDAQIMRSMRNLRMTLAEHRLDLTEDVSSELRALVLKRDYNADEEANPEEELKALRAELKTLNSQAAHSTRRIKAPTAGLYSAVVDGYETLLTPEAGAALKPSELTGLRPDSSVSSGVGKLILGDDWYYAAAVRTKDAEKLKELESSGRKLQLQFSKSIDQPLPVKIYSVGEAENGRCVVLFQGRTHLAQLTLLRQQSARIISSGVKGIRVPKEALHATESRLDRETGEQIRVNQSGVYCVVGKEAWFKPVEVLYNGDGFLLVKPTAEKQENLLRPGDQVIVAAKGLYDGKIVE